MTSPMFSLPLPPRISTRILVWLSMFFCLLPVAQAFGVLEFMEKSPIRVEETGLVMSKNGSFIEVFPILSRASPLEPFERVCHLRLPFRCLQNLWAASVTDEILAHQEILKAAAKSVIILTHTFLGTAFLYDKSTAITARHLFGSPFPESEPFRYCSVRPNSEAPFILSCMRQNQGLTTKEPVKFQLKLPTLVSDAHLNDFALVAIDAGVSPEPPAHFFTPTSRIPRVGDTVIVMGYAMNPPEDKFPMDVGSEGKVRGKVWAHLVAKLYHKFEDLSIGVGVIRELAGSHIVHSASVLEGQSGGPIILLQDLFDFHPSDPKAKIPFLGIQTHGSEYGYQIGILVNHPALIQYLGQLEGLPLEMPELNGDLKNHQTPQPLKTIEEMKKKAAAARAAKEG